MRQVTFVLLLALAWSSAGACVEPPKRIDVVDVAGVKINAIDVASVESSTILTSEQIAKIPVPRDITALDCWGTREKKMKRECRGSLPIEECPVSASWAGL